MSSRQEEKARRRQEREAAERAAASAEARAKRLRAAVTALMAIAAVVVVVLLVTRGSGDGSGSPEPSSSAAGAALPEVAERDLGKAAKTAGCTLRTDPDEGAQHTSEPVNYKINPPTTGSHNPEPALDGIYDDANPPRTESALHALEHGRVAFQYRQGIKPKRLDQLQTLASEPLNGKDAYKTLLFRDTSGMDGAVVATAWKQALVCPTITDATFDALRAFRLRYVDKGPESSVPPNN